MTDTATASPWTEEDVERAAEAAWFYFKSQDGGDPNQTEALRVAMAALAPRVAELQRAAKVEALDRVAAAIDTAAGTDDGTAGLAWALAIIRNHANEIERGDR